jgi:hypothetical protein
VVSTHNGEQLIGFDGSRCSVNVMPALTPQDILINSAESLLQLRDVVLARSEEEVCRELVLRIPVSENLRLQIARQALETDAWDERSMVPVSMTAARDNASSTNQSEPIEPTQGEPGHIAHITLPLRAQDGGTGVR